MKKTLLSLTALCTLALSGCIYEVVPGAPVSGLPRENHNGPQPQFEFERFDSYRLDEATRRAVLDIKRQSPNLFRDHRSFVVGSLAKASSIGRTEAIGRAIGASLTQSVGRTARAQHVRYNDNMFVITRDASLTLSPEASDLANRLNATAMFVGTYQVLSDSIKVDLNVIRASDRTVLTKHSFVIPMDPKIRAITELR